MGYRDALLKVILSGCIAIALAAQTSVDFDTVVKDADAARDAGDIGKAVDLYQRALHLKPDWNQGWWVLGSVLYDAKRYQEATDAFTPLTVLDPDKSPGWAMVGLCEFETGHYKEALPELRKAVKLGLPPGLYDVAQYHIALILIRASEFEAALDMISRDAARGNENPKLTEAMGIGALRKAILPKDVPPAEHELVMAVGQAMCHAAASHGKEATAEFETILSKYPTIPELHYLDGLVLLQSNPDKALEAFEQELALSPKHSQALISVAAELVKRDEYRAALPYAKRAVDSQPRYFAARAMLGKVLVDGGIDPQQGIKELESAAAIEPANPQCHLALASAYAKTGRKADAAAQRAEFLRLRAQIDAAAAGPT